MLLSFALIFLFGLLAGAICQKLRLPALVGILLVGILLGPHILGWLDGSVLSVSAELRSVALIIILARAGLSLNIDDLRKIGRAAVLLSFVPACFEMGGTFILAQILLDLPMLDAALLAAVVASASPAVIVPRMLKLMETGYGTEKRIPQMILAGDSVDDIFNIVVFSALLGLYKGESVSAAQFAVVPVSILCGALGGAAIGLLLTALFKRLHMRDSQKVLILLGISFLLVAFEEEIAAVVPFSGLLAVMTIGVTLLQTRPQVAARLSAKLSKLWVGAEILLFVLVGAGMNIEYAASAGLYTIALLVCVLLIRAVGIWLCLLGTKLNGKERLFCTFTGVPKATVQAAIGGIPLALGLPNGETILAVAVLTILFTAPIGALLIDLSYRRLLSKAEPAHSSSAK